MVIIMKYMIPKNKDIKEKDKHNFRLFRFEVGNS